MASRLITSPIAPEAEGMDVQQVRAVDLGGRMARQRQRQITRRDAAAVVRHPDQGLAAVGIFHGDPARACVDGVLNEFLNSRCGPLDHLARRDTVDRGIVKLTDDRGIIGYIGVSQGHNARPSM